MENLTCLFSPKLGYDVSKTKLKPKDPQVLEIESRLRHSISAHRDTLLSKSVDISESRRAFLNQVIDRVSTLNGGLSNNLDNDETIQTGKTKIKLVSVDVEKTKVHQIIRERIARDAADFLNIALRGQSEEDSVRDGCYVGDNFIPNTHVTMAYGERTTQSAMRENFGALRGCRVEVLVKAFIWGERVAALAVDVTSLDGKLVPGFDNAFSHITVWVADGARAYMSNELPELVESGKATRTDLSVPIALSGTISFWDSDNKVMAI